MKPDQLYQELKIIAEKLGLHVSEQNFRNAGVRVKSGHCVVKGSIHHCIIDKHIRTNHKAEALAECLSQMPHESIYIIPAVREYLERYKPIKASIESEAGQEEQK